MSWLLLFTLFMLTMYLHFKDFKTRGDVRHGFENLLDTTLKDVCFRDEDLLLSSVFRYTILGPASNLRKDLEAYRAEPNSTSDPGSPYWKAIWLALANTDVPTYTLSHFNFWINQQIIPKLENTILASEELQSRDAVNSPA